MIKRFHRPNAPALPDRRRLGCVLRALAAAGAALASLAPAAAVAAPRDLSLSVEWHKTLGAKPSDAWRPREQAQPLMSPKANFLFFSVPDGLLAWNRLTGQPLWRKPTAERVVGTPVLQGARLFAATLDGQVHALDAQTGAAVWKEPAKLGVTVRGPLAADERHVYVPADPPSVIALDGRDGHPAWRWTASVDRPFTVEGQSGVLLLGDQAIFGTATGKVVSVSARDGGMTWETPLEDATRSPYGDVDQTPLAVIRPGAEAWILAVSQSGGLAALAAGDGKVQWQLAEEALGQVYLQGGLAISVSALGKLLVVRVQDGKVLRNVLLACSPSGKLAFVEDGLALLPHEAGLDVLDWRAGVLRSRLATEVGFAAAPLFHDGVAWSLSNAGVLYAIRVRPAAEVTDLW